VPCYFTHKHEGILLYNTPIHGSFPTFAQDIGFENINME